MRYVHLLVCATAILVLVHAEAQTPKAAPDIVVAPFAAEGGKDSCSEQLVAALKLKGVAAVRDPQLTEKNLGSAPAPWAVLGRLSPKEGQFHLELQLLDVKSGEEMRSYFNSDKDPQVACRAVEKVAERIVAFLKEQKP